MATTTWLTKRGVAHDYIDVSEDYDALQYVLGLGAQESPVVVVGDKWWTGYRPVELKGLL